MLGTNKIQPQDAELLLLSDDPQEICNIVTAAHQAKSCQEDTGSVNHLQPVLR